MNSRLTLEKLREAAQKGAAIRSRVKLQPAAGEGTKVFPPTYSGAVYATEERRLSGYPDPVKCVLLDSVQSQANRMEEALQQAIDSDRFKKVGVSLPLIVVDFTGFWGQEQAKKHPAKTDTDLTDDLRLIEPVGKITSLQAPHRIADAILRDSLVPADGKVSDAKLFRAKSEKSESDFGRKLRRVSAQNATTLFELCPTALIFGMWDSTGPKGGLGIKFERAMVSEVVGINAVPGVKTSSRIDPLSIQKESGPLYRRPDGGWTVDPAEAVDELKEGNPTGKKLLFKPRKTENGPVDIFHMPGEKKYPDQGRPSEANHGNVPPDIDYREKAKDEAGRPIPVGGFTITEAEQTVVLSFPALRRLQFPVEKIPDGKTQSDVDEAARTVLAAIGLCAAALAAEAGLDLRSRCLLWPTNPLTWELLGRPGKMDTGLTLEADEAISLLKQAIDAAKQLGLPWREEPVRLIPSDDLVKLVKKSQELALGGEGEDD